MRATTATIIETAMGADTTVSPSQARRAMSLLRGEDQQPSAQLADHIRDVAVRLATELRDYSERQYYRKAEAAEHLRCSTRSLDYWRAQGRLPFHRLGRGLITFKRSDLDRFMASCRIDTEECER
jgi:excisionase family DNA binding protein